MVVGVDKSRVPVTRLDWGDGQTKSDVPTDIFRQGHKNILARGAKIPCPLTYSARGAKI